ncbi:hypothetical protein KIN20_023089 [Parelaphostrongylus tenuis]|uniref:Uncharacterized protein n=1 Tax=Parelaphostrongylus tenuis TaxID=148309 RepID=A0AAD5N669_PARTN|nr:hypothetical protein KIN20_023089 [Parelaphostrongylus tenuis]
MYSCTVGDEQEQNLIGDNPCRPSKRAIKALFRWICVLLLVLLLAEVESQTWYTGDNSTVSGCSTHCAVEDDDLSCWNSTLNFFTRVLIGKLRHYTAVQVDIDQWHRRHGKPEGQDMGLLASEIEKSFLKELQPEDILDRNHCDPCCQRCQR